jgi:cathepsin L
MRKAAYENRVMIADAQNKRPDRLWTAGVNEFWDWTTPEMSKLFGWAGGARPLENFGGSMLQSSNKATFLHKVNRTSPLPEEKTWTHLKTMQTIKSQGACGSCWVIAAVTTLESATELKKKARTFSAQEILNCVPNPKQCGGEGGCRGATVELAVDWVMKNGAAEEYQAPYIGADRTCSRDAQLKLAGEKKKRSVGGNGFGMYAWETIPQNKYEPLMRAIAETGPTAVSVDASPWHVYEKGIFDACPVDAIINHAVVAIGYGIDKEKNTKFWHIQNSWGMTWGEKGTIRLLRRDDDEKNCGIDNKPELGTGCKGGPPKVTVCGMCGVLYDSVIVHLK